MKKIPLVGLTIGIMLVVDVANAASLIGDAINLQYYFNGGAYNVMGGPGSFVAGSTSFDFGDNLPSNPYFTVSANASQIIFDYKGSAYWTNSPTSFNSGGLYIANGILVTDNTFSFESVAVNPSTDLIGFSISNVTFDTHNIAIDWNDRPFSAGLKVVLDINSTPVPIPATVWLFSSGLAGLGFIGNRRPKKSTA
jgi:hypothetical protein